MLCIVFGIMMASLFWAWIGPWAGAVGVASTIALYLTMSYWPRKP